MRKIQIALLTLMLSGCAAEQDASSVSFEFPFHGAISSCNWPNLEGLQATLFISGHLDQPCELAVSSTFTAEGICSGIAKGSERYLLLAYHMPANTTTDAPAADIGYMVSYVDLSSGAVAPGATNVEHQLIDNGVTAELINTTSAVNDLPLEGVNVIGDDPLERAKAWSKSLILERQNSSTPLDIDGDDCPNLHEICVGTYAALDVTDAETCGL
jgi:hypothetical protein